MNRNRILIVGEAGQLRQNLVEILLRDPKNVVSCVELLTPDGDQPARFIPPDSARYHLHQVDWGDTENIDVSRSVVAADQVIDLCELSESRDSVPLSRRKTVSLHLLRRTIAAWQQELASRVYLRVVPKCAAGPALLSHDAKPRHTELMPSAARLVEVLLPEIFGPLDTTKCFFGETISALLAGETCRLAQQTRDWLYAEDAAEAVLAAMRDGEHGTRYRIRDPQGGHSDYAIGTFICDQLDQIIPRHVGSYMELVSGANANALTASSYAQHAVSLDESTGWAIRNDFYCALANTVKWYVDQHDWWHGDGLIHLGPVRNAAG